MCVTHYRSVEPNIGPKVQEITSSPAEIVAPPKPPSLSTPLLSNPSSITSAPPVPPPASMSTNPPPPPSGGHMTSSPGLLPIPFNAAPPVMPDAGMGMGFPSSMMMGDEPFAKKQRMDVTDGLIPEQEIITLHPVRVTSVFCVCVCACVYTYMCKLWIYVCMNFIAVEYNCGFLITTMC